MDTGTKEELGRLSANAMRLQNRRRIAWISLWSIFIILAVAVFVPVVFGPAMTVHIQNLIPLFSTVVLAMTGNVAFYMGSSAYMVNSLNRDLFAANQNPSQSPRVQFDRYEVAEIPGDSGSNLPRG